MIGFRKLTDSLLSVLLLVMFPVTTGLIVLAEPIIMFLGGSGYEAAVPTLQILSIAVLFAIVGGMLSNCINIPTGKEKLSLKATLIAAGSNVAINIWAIPLWQHNGAAIATVVAEMSVLLVCFLGNKEIKKLVTGKVLAKNIIHAVIGSISIPVIVCLLKQVIVNNLLLCFTSAAISALAYGGILLLLRNDYMLMALRMIRVKVSKSK